MCGIVIVIGRSREDGLAIAAKMGRALAHRGPDDSGIEFFPFPGEPPGGKGITLAHRRLSILDLSAAGHQPMLTPSRNFAIVYNGEIYNHLSLRKKLLNGQHFTSSSDTESILQMWEKYGPDSLTELRGIFAFALLDTRKGELHLVRDRLGIKPLYWSQLPDHSGILIASELRAFFASGVLPRHFSHDAVESYLAHGSIVAPLTIHPDIHEFPAGEYWAIERDRIQCKRRYWSWPTVDPDINEQEAIAINTGLLQPAIGENLLSDASLGIFLSGGIDSSVVAALAAEQQVPFTLTLDFHEQGYSEASIAQRTATRLGTNHHSINVTNASVAEQIVNALNAMDQPSKDGFNTFIISKVARSLGLAVVLSGLGGDEVYCGYNMFSRLPASFRRWRYLRALPKWIRHPISDKLARMHTSHFQKASGMLDAPDNIVDFYLARRQHFTPFERRTLGYGLTNNHLGIPKSNYEYLKSLMNPKYLVHSFGTADIHIPMMNTLVRDSDVMSMAHSLELRVPLLDHRLIEANYGFPDTLRMDANIPKKLLSLSAKNALSDEVIYRPKQGFQVPTRQWLHRAEFESLRHQVLSPHNLRALNADGMKYILDTVVNHKNRGYDFLWMLIALEYFLQHHDLVGV